MKTMITAAALAAAILRGMTAASATADAQPRYRHGLAQGPRWRSWRHGYYSRYHRHPIRVCRHGRCWYR